MFTTPVSILPSSEHVGRLFTPALTGKCDWSYRSLVSGSIGVLTALWYARQMLTLMEREANSLFFMQSFQHLLVFSGMAQSHFPLIFLSSRSWRDIQGNLMNYLPNLIFNNIHGFRTHNKSPQKMRQISTVQSHSDELSAGSTLFLFR